MHDENREEFEHYPVLHDEVISFLSPEPGMTFLDLTIGLGGHAKKILEHIRPGGILIGIDIDPEAIDIAKRNLERFKDSITFEHSNFSRFDEVLSKKNISSVDGILLDLGLSSYQLGKDERGFSFQREGPLDMRFDKSSQLKAEDIVNKFKKDELEKILREFGEEKFSHRIAKLIVQKRISEPIKTTTQLSSIIKRAYPKKWFRIHPATRSFQAIRIKVNDELENLRNTVEKCPEFLNRNGKVAVISYHSLEDRIVKRIFKKFKGKGILKILTKKPIRASEKEVKENRRSRSGKLRVGQRI